MNEPTTTPSKAVLVAEPSQLHDQEKSPRQARTLFLVAGAGHRTICLWQTLFRSGVLGIDTCAHPRYTEPVVRSLFSELTHQILVQSPTMKKAPPGR